MSTNPHRRSRRSWKLGRPHHKSSNRTMVQFVDVPIPLGVEGIVDIWVKDLTLEQMVGALMPHDLHQHTELFLERMRPDILPARRKELVREVIPDGSFNFSSATFALVVASLVVNQLTHHLIL